MNALCSKRDRTRCQLIMVGVTCPSRMPRSASVHKPDK